MANETIPLAKHEFRPDKLDFPVLVSEKLDGVPIKFTIMRRDGRLSVTTESRQGEMMLSAYDDAIALTKMNAGIFEEGYVYFFVWEVTHLTFKTFKDISGVVRRQTPQEDLIYNLFDYDAIRIEDWENGEGHTASFLVRLGCALEFNLPPNFKIIPHLPYADAETLQDMLDNTPIADDQEGWAIRSYSAPFKPGTRHWDYQVIVKEPTIDLRIIRAEEGKGKNAGAVGRLIALYKGEEIGIGPGKLSYAERKAIWDETKRNGYLSVPVPGGFRSGRMIAKIKYKPDPSYTALRQPTFQAWHDKTEPDA